MSNSHDIDDHGGDRLGIAFLSAPLYATKLVGLVFPWCGNQLIPLSIWVDGIIRA